MTKTTLQLLDGLGRPALRLTGVVILALVGLAIAWQFWAWALWNRPPADMPMQVLLLALIPQIPQVVDQITRTFEKQARTAFGAGLPNPHGGPAAP